jgi:hypothetical protein
MEKHIINGILSDNVLGVVYMGYSNGVFHVGEGCHELDDLILDIPDASNIVNIYMSLATRSRGRSKYDHLINLTYFLGKSQIIENHTHYDVIQAGDKYYIIFKLGG